MVLNDEKIFDMHTLILFFKELPTIILLSKKKVTVGRKECDVCLDGRTISRLHATLVASEEEFPTYVVVKDHDSKLGTFYMKNESKYQIKIDHEQKLEINDIIIFGSKAYAYRVENCEICVCFSGICQEDAKKLTTKIHSLGNLVANAWKSDYTHLISQDTKLTFKFLLALCQKKHIVTPAWIDDMYLGIIYPPEIK